MKNGSELDGAQLELRIKEHCRNYPGRRKFNPDEVSKELLNKFHFDYKKFLRKEALFRLSVSETLNKLNLSDASPPPEIIEEISVIQTIQSTEQKNIRKRKANSILKKDVVDVIVSSDEEKERQFETRPNNNRANKNLMKLYSGNNIGSSPASSTSTDKKKKQPEKTEKPLPAQTRGLSNVSSLNILPKTVTVSFKDVGGCIKQQIEALRLVSHLKHPAMHEAFKLEPPKGILVHGPPGCGKSLFAQAIAGQLKVPLLQLAATELVSGVSGETEDKIRQLFETAKSHAPCILVLDDVDSIAPRRETAQREMERRVVSQLCNSLDELHAPPKEKPLSERLKFDANGDVSLEKEEVKEKNKYVLVIGTTSRPDSLDNGLRRAGRFDNEIALGIPDEDARQEILKNICTVPLDESVNLIQLARLTPGYVGADLRALVREAAKCALDRILDNMVERPKKKNMTKSDFEGELEKLISFLDNEEDESVQFSIEKCKVSTIDFERALESVQPSAKREGFATVPDVSWDDIGALSQYPVKRKEDFALLGVSTKPQGVLLCGPPGCGKTLLAKAVANETGMNFISVKGPELLNMYVGESERAVRTVFQRARDSSPCVIFFDEIDALCPKRSNNESTGGARLVNQLLTEMDGVEGRKQVFLIGATNRPDIVDPAILRPGRLDKILFVDFPSSDDREDIFKKTTKNGKALQLADDINFKEIANLPELDGFTGADITALVHEASIIALQQRIIGNDLEVKEVGMEHFKAAVKNIRPSVTEADRKKYTKMKEIYALKGI